MHPSPRLLSTADLQLLQQALQRHQAGDLAGAREAYQKVLSHRPAFAEVWNNLGAVLLDLRLPAEAETACRQALQLKPDYPVAFCNLGNVVKSVGRLAEAEAAYRSALQLQPKYADAYSNLGSVLTDLGRFDEAEAACRQALERNRHLAEAHSNLGSVLMRLGRFSEAETAYRAAVVLQPTHPVFHSNLGNALRELVRLREAFEAYRRALELRPGYPEAYCNLGNLFRDLGRLAEAEQAYRQAITLKPDYAEAHNNLLMILHYRPDATNTLIRESALRFGEQYDGRTAEPLCMYRGLTDTQCLRIGYVSGDFRNHPVGYFFSSVLPAHDRSTFEIFCYTTAVRTDEVTDYLRLASDHWTSLVGLSDQDAARLIADDCIDILVDLSGHTAHNRLPVFALRPAPVQVSWLGYFGTTGLRSMDYILADRYVVPVAEEQYYTEKIQRLPHSYLCFSPPVDAPPVGPLPADEGNGIRFGCFNNWCKITPDVLLLWVTLLKNIPHARLFLKTHSLGEPGIRQQFVALCAQQGIGAERLLLEGASPRKELLAAYNRVDIALDPFPYGGGTTTAEALWMGVPVVTLQGDRWVGRVSQSILAAVELPELVAQSCDEYLAIATALAADLHRLRELRHGLRQRMQQSPFCDATGFTHDLERAFHEMWNAQIRSACSAAGHPTVPFVS